MRKMILRYCALVAVLLSLSACDKLLEFPPENETPTAEALVTAEDGQMLLNSCYDVARSSKFLGGNHYILSELMADAIDGTDLTGDYLSYYSRGTGIFMGATRDFWSEPYIMIYRVNSLLEQVEGLELISQDDINRMRGECLLLRAIGHFEMVRMFGQPYAPNSSNTQLGIPIRLKPSQETVLRSTVGEVYTQLLTDLNEAAGLIPEGNDIYGDRWSVHGMLAKVYFQMNDFENAYFHSNKVIEEGGFTLTENVGDKYQKAFGSTEGVLEWVSNSENTNNSASGIYGAYGSFSGTPTLRINLDTYSSMLLGGNDRSEAFVALQDNGDIYPVKYNPDNSDNEFINVPYIHLTQLMLIRAEAAAEAGMDLVGPQSDLSAIRVRGGEGVVVTTDPQEIIAIARELRELELFLEGDRLHELKRIAVLENPNLMIRGAIWNCPGLVVQLPDIELSGNINLQDNPEGGC